MTHMFKAQIISTENMAIHPGSEYSFKRKTILVERLT